MPLSVQSERVDHTDDAAWKNWRKALDKLHRNDLERKEKESRDLAEKHAREAEEEAAKALATLKDARRREDEAAQTKCERWVTAMGAYRLRARARSTSRCNLPTT